MSSKNYIGIISIVVIICCIFQSSSLETKNGVAEEDFERQQNKNQMNFDCVLDMVKLITTLENFKSHTKTQVFTSIKNAASRCNIHPNTL